MKKQKAVSQVMNNIILSVVIIGAIILFCEWFAMRQLSAYGWI
jgi:hypothetical protein